MPSSRNLSDMFFTGGATTSQAVEATTDSQFESTSFKLKRTRSLGLLDEFIPGKIKELFVQDDYPHLQEADHRPSSTTLADMATQERFGSLVDVKEAKLSYTNLGTLLHEQHESVDVPQCVSGLFHDDVMVDIPDIVSNGYVPSFENLPNAPILMYSASRNTPAPKAASHIVPTNADIIVATSPKVAPSPMEPDNPNADPFAQLHDDGALVDQPNSHVDYLSHNWRESDISKSWRYIVLRRKAVANSARLENASWRTWAQAKYNLKTINPATVNWLKDSDVTWLYGPICQGATDSEFFKSSGNNLSALSGASTLQKNNSSTALDTFVHLFDEPKTKPILKKRTMQEILSTSSYPASNNTPSVNPNATHNSLGGTSSTKKEEQGLYLDDVNNTFNHNYQNINPVLVPISTTASNTSSLMNSPALYPHAGTASPLVSHDSIVSPTIAALTKAKVSKKDRHIHFNDRVEQCVSLEYTGSETEDELAGMTMHERARAGAFNFNDSEDEDSDMEDEGKLTDVEESVPVNYNGDFTDDGNDDSDDDGFFLSVRSSSSLSLQQGVMGLTNIPSNATSLSNDAVSQSESQKPLTIRTIEPLPATTLKYGSDDEDEADGQFSVSHNQTTNRSGPQYSYNYDYNSVFVCDESATPGITIVDVPESLELDTLDLGTIPVEAVVDVPFEMPDYEGSYDLSGTSSNGGYDTSNLIATDFEVVDVPALGLGSEMVDVPDFSGSFSRTSNSNIAGTFARTSNPNIAGSFSRTSNPNIAGSFLRQTSSSTLSKSGSQTGFGFSNVPLHASSSSNGNIKSFLLNDDDDSSDSDDGAPGAIRPPSSIFRTSPSTTTVSPSTDKFNGSFTSDGDSSYASLTSIAERNSIKHGEGDESGAPNSLLNVANAAAKDLANKIVGGWK
ncbi:hypothetical protein BABINDRAFT_168856 [Babjeviella inositovora NRRL Y-12698]|uniref:Nitrogen regulatory protein areA GATA-like domain-containing protein n=1 Tax=Babjeviella inositovora NRRL Y-12698 TaxID=984486 RepID=A0A1E3QJN5_9ASCO|nr:uncharacterized protein BABINDRAFT_168856 [Babjeviella inositovora NRRL Y-12698]ODQ77903.1 hypothetical protein BABINDRAFT_168856 [Babjeviella inositovora NRRL Y-12698]